MAPRVQPPNQDRATQAVGHNRRRTTQAIGQQHTSPLRAECEARRREIVLILGCGNGLVRDPMNPDFTVFSQGLLKPNEMMKKSSGSPPTTFPALNIIGIGPVGFGGATLGRDGTTLPRIHRQLAPNYQGACNHLLAGATPTASRKRCDACKKVRIKCEPVENDPMGACRRCVRLDFTCNFVCGGTSSVSGSASLANILTSVSREATEGRSLQFPPTFFAAPVPELACPMSLTDIQGRNRFAAARRDRAEMAYCVLLTGASGGFLFFCCRKSLLGQW